MPPTTLPTTCPLDCPDTCGLDVTVEDGRVTRLDGRADHPVTGGFICGKVRRFAVRQEHPDRILYPMRRVGPKGDGRFERIAWDDAVRLITDRFRDIAEEWGGEAILPFHYGGSNGVVTEGFLDRLYFARLGASRLAKTICAAPTTAAATAMYGKMPGVAFEDYVDARGILLWGGNPRASHIHLMPFLREARRRGAFVASVDPVGTLAASEVDAHLPVYPGADLPLALGFVHRWREQGLVDEAFLAQHTVGAGALFAAAEAWSLERAAEEARVPFADAVRVADAFAAASPAVVRCGWGPERNRNGGHAVAAILALPAVLGKFGVRGGGYTLSNSGAARFDAEAALGPIGWDARVVNMTRLGEALTELADPPVRALFVYNANPVATVPEQRVVVNGLEREDLFTVVFDQVLTDTARYADVLLPATTFLEHWDLRVGYGTYVVGGVRPVLPPAGEAKSNVEVFGVLARAMGYDDEPFTWDGETAVRRAAGALELPGDVPAQGALDGAMQVPFDFPGSTPVMFDGVMPRTPDGKIHLAPAVLGSPAYRYLPPPDDAPPLVLITPSTSRTVNSTLGESALGHLVVTLHPHDASARGIAAGDAVRVFNNIGEVWCTAAVDDRVRPGVVRMPKGAWRRASANGWTANALCPAEVSDVGEGACFNDARVEVGRQV
jgi:anaerobic selenocysteine-containing dehydrogenase